MVTNTRHIGQVQQQLAVRDRLGGRLGYKVLRLVPEADTVVFEPPHYNDHTFSAAATSRCFAEAKRRHAFETCSCGFYAYRTLGGGLDHWRTACAASANEFIVEVSLSGTVVVAEHGYRASQQRVTSIFVPPCFGCAGRAERVARHVSGYLVGACEGCAPLEYRGFDFATLAMIVSPAGFSPIKVSAEQSFSQAC